MKIYEKLAKKGAKLYAKSIAGIMSANSSLSLELLAPEKDVFTEIISITIGDIYDYNTGNKLQSFDFYLTLRHRTIREFDIPFFLTLPHKKIYLYSNVTREDPFYVEIKNETTFSIMFEFVLELAEIKKEVYKEVFEEYFEKFEEYFEKISPGK